MREFSSGIVGCIICILALMGSVLGGFCLGGESGIRDVTNYDYKTDLTGTFATDNAPEYVDYNPAANFVGYPKNSVTYEESRTANAYRYEVSPTDEITVNKTINNTQTNYDNVWLNATKPQTQIFLNITDITGVWPLKTEYGFTYNATVEMDPVNNGMKGVSLSVLLYTHFSKLGDNVEISIQNRGAPVLITPSAPVQTNITQNTGMGNWWGYTSTAYSTITKIVWEKPTTITAYSGDTVRFTSDVYSTHVFFAYRTSLGNYPLVDANFVYSKMKYNTIEINRDSDFPTVPTGGSFYPSSQIYMYNRDSGTGYPTAALGTVDPQPGGAQMPYNIRSYFGGVTKFRDIIEGTLKETTETSIYITYGEYKILFAANVPNWTSTGGTPGVGKYSEITAANCPVRLILPNGINSTHVVIAGGTTAQIPIDDFYVIYKILPAMGNLYNASAILEIGRMNLISVNVNTDSNYTMTYYPVSDVSTEMLIKWNGTQNIGPDNSYFGYTYNMKVVPTSKNIPYVTTLYSILRDMGIEYYSHINLDLTYGTYPVLFYADGLISNSINIGSQSQAIYNPTMDDNNKPEKIVVTSGTAQLFDDNNMLITTKPINEIYVINRYYSSSGVAMSTAVNMRGTATSDIVALNSAINNDSNFPRRGDFGGTLPDNTYDHNYSKSILMKYTGTQFNNLGKERPGPTADKTFTTVLYRSDTDGRTANPALTKLSDVLAAINANNYVSVEFTLGYGTRPIMFLQQGWSYSSGTSSIYDPTHGYNVSYTSYSYYKEFNDDAFPDKIVYDRPTEKVKAYKDGRLLWTENAANIEVIWKYRIVNDNNTFSDFVTDQSVTMRGLAKLEPTYAYADPSKGVVLDVPFAEWQNGYKNNVINITVAKQSGANNDLTITAGNASIRLDRNVLTDQMTATVTKHDGTVETRDLGKWHNAQITINASAGTVAFTPIPGTGMPNFTNPVELNSTTIVWNDWYTGGVIEKLMFTTSGKSLRWSVTSTSVFLNTYGIVMYNPSVNVTDYFPEMENWRLNFFSFALLGDSMTVNDQTFPVNRTTGKITVTDTFGKTTTGDLTNVYVTKDNGHTYFNFANENKSIDLGETVNDRVSFTGLWYFTTGLFEVTQGTEKYYDWQIDGRLHATLPQMCLMFIGILIAGLIICKAILRFEIGLIDWVILISATVISLIVAGGNL